MNDFLAPHQVHKMASSSTLGLDSDEDKVFDSLEEQVAYHKERYRLILDMLNDTRAELDEFQVSSKELEDELERELAQTDKQQAELRDRVAKLETERDDWKAKYLAAQKSHNAMVGNMQLEIDNLRSERDSVRVAMRDLEMGNDDLERNERVATSSLLDLESKYNRAIEEKTLLEQEVVIKNELEEERQRLKDELRDANSEIGILRDQLSRTPVPPPATLEPHDVSYVEVSIANATIGTPPAASAIPRSIGGITRSNSSPSFQRTLGMSALNRSTTSRNLAMAAGSPVPARVRQQGTSMIPMSPSRASNLNAQSAPAPAQKSKGVQMVSDLRARIRAMDSKLAPKGKRAVSAPMPTASSSTAPHSRVKAIAATPGEASSVMSPNGWVLVSDQDDTPTPGPSGMPLEPTSPIRRHHRAPSSNGTTSSKPLPSRPGIPSPLAQSMNRSTSSKRPPSRTAHNSRPMSPSLLPVPGSSRTKSPSPAFGMSSIAFPTDRPPSRLLGRGHPPISGAHRPMTPDTPLRRSSRRSSIGLQKDLPPTGIPAPLNTPGRPLSIPSHSALPPPVPRIPSAHLKKPAGALAASRRRPSVSEMKGHRGS